MDIELKPCPFCGSDEVFIHWQGARYGRAIYFVKCEKCGAETRAFSLRADTSELKGSPKEWDNSAAFNALESWNRRAAP